MAWNNVPAALAVCLGICGAGAAQAGITQAPALPAQVALNWTYFDEYAGAGLGVALEATGTASVHNGQWEAAVTQLTPGLIHLGEDAGMVFRPVGVTLGHLPVWKDITLDYVNHVLTADAYVDDVRVADNRRLFFTNGFEFGPDTQPEGKATLWANSAGLCVLTYPTCSYSAYWAPVELGTVTVSSVPENGTMGSMALGLVLLGGLARRGRQIRP